MKHAADEANARRGILKSEQVRLLEIEATVDTGAVRCVIPERVKDALGLAPAFRKRVQYADGSSQGVDVTARARRLGRASEGGYGAGAGVMGASPCSDHV